MAMEARELRIFAAVAAERGFAKAAERLFLTQSAVSQSVANLERKLGTKLIIRAVPPELTEAGRRVLRYARLLEREETTLLEEIDNMRRGMFSTLSIAINSFIASHYSVDLLREFTRRMPMSRVALDVLPSREIIYAVESERFELGFGPFQSSMVHFETLPLFEERRILVVAGEHPSIALLVERPQEFLRQLTLITSYLDRAELRPAHRKLRDRFRAVWEINHTPLRLALVAAGLGAAYVEEEELDDNPLCRTFRRLTEFSFGRIERRIGVYHKKGRYLSDAGNTMIRLCRECWPAGNT